MKIVAISDSHSLHEKLKIPKADMLIVAGDFTLMGTQKEVEFFNHWLKMLPVKYKIVIAGNHDFLFEENQPTAQDTLTNAIYLQDSSVTIKGINIYGSPWQPRYHDWAFNLDRGQQLREKWEMIPVWTDILVTHSPPRGILDSDKGGEPQGCDDLRDMVINKIKPKFHIFGHIHPSYGKVKTEHTTFINASIENITLKKGLNKPIIFYI